jgi:type III restriction enzyme
LAFYTPDFFARTENGNYYLVETKGREDVDVPRKARAAVAWCESASTKNCKWEYVYVPQGVFGRMTGNSFEELVRTCQPALENVLQSEQLEERFPLFAGVLEPEEERPELKDLVDEATLKALPSRYQKAVEQAAMLFRFLENKQGINFASVFNPLLGSLDEAAKGLILRKLQNDLPPTVPEQKAWFSPYLEDVDQPLRNHLEKMASNLKRTLVFNNGLSPVGLLRSCLEYALDEKTKLGGVFASVKSHFSFSNAADLLTQVAEINDFRNTYVAHQEKELADSRLAKTHLGKWIGGLRSIVEIN